MLQFANVLMLMTSLHSRKSSILKLDYSLNNKVDFVLIFTTPKQSNSAYGVIFNLVPVVEFEVYRIVSSSNRSY